MRKLCLLFVLICFGCSPKNDAPNIHISLINRQQSLKISGINLPAIQDLARDSSNHFEDLLPVYKMPADTGLKDYQPAQPGKYIIKNDALEFTPDTPFAKRQTYFIRCYQYGDDGNIWNYVRSRKHPGQIRFIDLIFAP